MKIIEYDISKYNFIHELQASYKVDNLQQIHKDWSQAKSYELLDDIKTDQSTVYHKHFYNNISKTDWYTIYKQFIIDIIRPLFSESIIYQKIPKYFLNKPTFIHLMLFFIIID